MARTYVQQVTKEEMKEYGEFFKSVRQSLGLSSVKMAKELGVHYTTLRRWERGINIPNGDLYEIEQMVRTVVRNVKQAS